MLLFMTDVMMILGVLSEGGALNIEPTIPPILIGPLTKIGWALVVLGIVLLAVGVGVDQWKRRRGRERSWGIGEVLSGLLPIIIGIIAITLANT